MRNIGNRESKFKLSVEEPFSVTPDSGKLAVGESMQIHVDFRASQTRDFSSQMILHYDTGKCFYFMKVASAHFGSKSKHVGLQV